VQETPTRARCAHRPLKKERVRIFEIANFDENLIPSKPRRGVELCVTIVERNKDENSIPSNSPFFDYSDKLLGDVTRACACRAVVHVRSILAQPSNPRTLHPDPKSRRRAFRATTFHLCISEDSVYELKNEGETGASRSPVPRSELNPDRARYLHRDGNVLWRSFDLTDVP
jgi:hypothetical protein